MPLAPRTYRITANLFILALKRKLRVPLDSCPRRCRCTTPMDVYGDHYFKCTKANKGKLHNRIRDTFFAILRHLAPLAGLAASDNHVFLEPLGLLPAHPTRRPADVAIEALPNAFRDPISHLLVDVTSVSVPDKWGERDSFPVSVSLHHLRGENEKFAGHSRGDLTAGQLVQAILAHRYALLPCTFDPGGALGPAATGFLWKPPKRPTTALPNVPPNDIPLPASHASKCLREQCYTHISTFGLLQRANKGWREEHADKPFTKYYEARLPSQWATMQLGHNLVLAMSRHIAYHQKNGNKVLRNQCLNTSTTRPAHTRSAQVLSAIYNTWVPILLGNTA